jgi:catechol 2,3-dioxygenase-like lactoylglutathione lyase family enzyme
LPGQIVHIEIPADDTQKSQEFWGSLFGWQFQANPGPFEYHTTQISGEQGAAITNMEPGKRGHAAVLRGRRHQGGCGAGDGARRGGRRADAGSGHGLVLGL